MNLRTILWTYQPRQDGRCQIRIYVHHQGRKKYFGTGLCVFPQEWDASKGQVKNSHPLATRYNAAVSRKRLEIEAHFLDGGTWQAFDRKRKSGADLIKFGWAIIEEAEKGLLPLRPGTLKNYRATLNRLTAYTNGQGLAFEQIDQPFYDGFTTYLNEQCGCGPAGMGKHIKIIKRLMNIGLERELHQNTAHQDSRFKIHKVKRTKKVYLTEDEITQLEALDLSATPALEKERDRWLIAYHFVMRFSDAARIQRSHFLDMNERTYCKYQSVKTSIEAIVPAKARALDLLEQYDYQLNFTTNQQANRHIKTICAMAGINDPVHQGDQTGPKSSFVTTHTARRSAATNLYLNSASLELIAKLGGWENGDTVRVYLQASGLDSAKLAGDLAFFK